MNDIVLENVNVLCTDKIFLIPWTSVTERIREPKNTAMLNKVMSKIKTPSHIVWGENDMVKMFYCIYINLSRIITPIQLCFTSLLEYFLHIHLAI